MFQIVTNYSGIIDYSLEQNFHVFVQKLSEYFFPVVLDIKKKCCWDIIQIKKMIKNH